MHSSETEQQTMKDVDFDFVVKNDKDLDHLRYHARWVVEQTLR